MKDRFNPLATGLAGIRRASALSSVGGASSLIRPDASLRAQNAVVDINALKPHLSALWPRATVPTRLPAAALSAATLEHPAVGLPTGHIIFVYNLGPDSEDRDLWQLFAPYGAVQKVNIIMDQKKKECKGYGFVTMTHFDDAMIAISQLNGFTYEGKQLQVSLKTPRQPKI
jgi:hypothetical protein